MTEVVTAPGKLMLSGEYAVLEGAPAVVTAVDRRAFARLAAPGAGDAGKAPAEARAAFSEVERELGALGAEVQVDVGQLRAEGAKLGLGSSAAAAAAAAGLAYARHGRELVSKLSRDAVFRAALRGHRAISPEGSGADVAASVYGGFIRFRLGPAGVEVDSVAWPTTLRTRVVWTGQEARTSTYLERVRALKHAQPERYRGLIAGLTREAERFLTHIVAGDALGVVASAAAYGREMEQLGIAAGVPIVTDALRRVAALAERAGGAAKPSGAGGGDVALALFPDRRSEQQFDALCREYDLTLLPLEFGAPGVQSPGATTGEAE